jgi:putative transposase
LVEGYNKKHGPVGVAPIMANTYSQIHLQFVFAVQNRYGQIHEEIRERTEKYISGIVQGFGHKMLSIYCMPDHAHLLVGFRTNQSIADLMREVKSCSSKFLNIEKITKEKFNWQSGYGAFSYSKNDVPRVIDYILNQPNHHKTKSFKEEYVSLLKEFQIEYEDQYLFDWIN